MPDLPERGANTSTWCQPRSRLSVKCLRKVHASLVQERTRRAGKANLWRSRCMKASDGCGISMPDNNGNRQV